MSNVAYPAGWYSDAETAEIDSNYELQHGQLAADAADAADAHGVASPQHDAAMDAVAEYEWEYAPEPEAG